MVLAVVAGSLYAAGIYLLLRRRLAQLIVGLGLLTNGTNVLIFTAGGISRYPPPVVPAFPVDAATQYADPVPQSFILTAIVIGFGVLAFSLVLAHQVHPSSGHDEVEGKARG